MKRSTFLSLAFCLAAALLLGGCETQSQYETETSVPASHSSTTRVVKDEIPAEGDRKIPVIEQY